MWQRSFELYGIMDQPFLVFSPSGAELLSPADQYAMTGSVVHAVADGAELKRFDYWVLGRDASWSRELRGNDRYTYPETRSVVDLEHEQVLLSLGERPPLARLSADGQYVFDLACTDSATLERRRVADGQRSVLALDAALGACPGPGYYDSNTAFVVSGSNDSVVFSSQHRNEIVLASFSTGTASAHAVYEAAPVDGWRPGDMPVAVTFSPSERALATVNGDGKLRVWGYPELRQVLPDIQLGVTQAFRDCYCTPRSFSPVVWSADERWLATTNEAQDTVVLRACDGSIVTTIPTPPVGMVSDGFSQGPALIAFNPRGTGLAILSVSQGFGGVVSYYAISD
jgi:hypothetical protein